MDETTDFKSVEETCLDEPAVDFERATLEIANTDCKFSLSLIFPNNNNFLIKYFFRLIKYFSQVL